MVFEQPMPELYLSNQANPGLAHLVSPFDVTLGAMSQHRGQLREPLRLIARLAVMVDGSRRTGGFVMDNLEA